MATSLIVELLAKGILAAIGHQFDRNNAAIQATKSEVIAMKGNMEKFLRGMDKELNNLNDQLNTVYEAIKLIEHNNIREDMINAMVLVHDVSVRERVLEVSMVIYSIMHNTEVQQISIEVQNALLPASSLDDEFDHPLISTVTETFHNTTSAKEISKKVMKLDEEGIFSRVDHTTEDATHIVISAASHIDAQKEKLITASGALYTLCQTLCRTVQDCRGVYATAQGDGMFAHSGESEPPQNACQISLLYYWPTPDDFRRVESFVNGQVVEPQGQPKLLPIIDIMEKRDNQNKIKNVYLLGETGEGKSTLANVLTGTEHFYVSDAGTGTTKIEGALVSESGLLHGSHEIMVWDTPGMNDQQGRDKIYEQMLYQHLTRENTVSALIIVTKDGARIPNTLVNTMDVYRRAFGDAFTSSICVCIGLNEQKAKKTKIEAKFQTWRKDLCGIVQIREGSLDDRIFFYNAEDGEIQPNGQKLRDLVWNAEVRLTGTGVAILQGLQKMRSAQLKDEEKEAMFRASEDVFEAIRKELWNAPRVRVRYFPNYHRKIASISFEMLPFVGSRVLSYFRYYICGRENHEEEKVIVLNGVGQRAVDLLSKRFLTSYEVHHGAKVNVLIRTARQENLILQNTGSTTTQARRGKIQVQTYNIMHLEDELDTQVFDEVEQILQQIVIDPNFAATFGSFLPN